MPDLTTTRLEADGSVGRTAEFPAGATPGPDIKELEAHYSQTPLVKDLAVIPSAGERETSDSAVDRMAVVVPDFDYLRRSNICIAKEAVRYALDDLGRELPKERRIRRYIVRAEPLPRTASDAVDRVALQRILAAGSAAANHPQLSDSDRRLLNSSAGTIVVAVLSRIADGPRNIHPDMNIEIDLDLDSLARAETFAAVEFELGVEFPAEEAAKALTVRELIDLAKASIGEKEPTGSGPWKERYEPGRAVAPAATWSAVLNSAGEEDVPELRTVLKNRPVFMSFVFAAYKLFNLLCRVFLRLEVTGTERMLTMKRPFIVCPNHQSFLDPFIVCSTYSFDFFRNSFHVGASHFFTGGFIAFAARMLHVVPVDADTQLMKAMKAGAIGLKRGKILNIYPEGERAYDGELHDFKKGAAIFAVELGLPIVPVALDGLYKVWPRRTMRIRPAKVKVRFGEPFFAGDVLGNDDSASRSYDRVTTHLRETIAGMIDEMRTGGA